MISLTSSSAMWQSTYGLFCINFYIKQIFSDALWPVFSPIINLNCFLLSLCLCLIHFLTLSLINFLDGTGADLDPLKACSSLFLPSQPFHYLCPGVHKSFKLLRLACLSGFVDIPILVWSQRTFSVLRLSLHMEIEFLTCCPRRFSNMQRLSAHILAWWTVGVCLKEKLISHLGASTWILALVSLLFLVLSVYQKRPAG